MSDKFTVIPQHVGFIMDGNGRWANAKGKPRNYGHRKGADVIEEVVGVCFKHGVKCVTLYAFSTENWSRPKEEIDEIMDLLEKFIVRYTPKLFEEKIRLKVLGDITALNPQMQKTIIERMDQTKDFIGRTVNIALNYGSRQELCYAYNKMIKDGVKEVTPNVISSYLYTGDQPDVDLIVRTSGEQRLSNFLLYQSAYAELYFTDTHWPDFHRKEVEKALEWFGGRKRRFGNVK